MTRARRSTAGFTLLELLMVVVIIAILASIGLPRYLRAAEKSRATEILNILQAVRESQIRYRAQNGAYSVDLAELDTEIPPEAQIVNWNQPQLQANGAGDMGSVEYHRRTGPYQGWHIGIQYTSGQLCGDFPPLQLALAVCSPG